MIRGMPRSFTGQIFALVSAIMAATAVVVMGLVWMSLAQRLRSDQEIRMQEALRQAAMLLESRYDDQVLRRMDALTDQRIALARQLDIYKGLLDTLYTRQAAGDISLREAQTIALDAARTASVSGGVNLFVFDASLQGLAHADPTLIGRNWRTMGAPGPQSPLLRSRDIVDRDGHDVLLISWPAPSPDHPQRHLARLAAFPPWGWYVGVSVDYATLERRFSGNAEHFKQDTLAALAQMRLGNTGSFFAVDEQGKSLIPLAAPIGDALGEQLEDIRAVNAAYDDPARFLLKAGQRILVAYAVFLNNLGWRIGLVMDSAELAAPAQALALVQTLALGLRFLAGLALAWSLARMMSSPLLRLERCVRAVSPMDGVDAASRDQVRTLANSCPGEVGRLAGAWAETMDALHDGLAVQANARQAQEEVARQLEASREELMHLNQELEQRVQVRTAALEAANDRLRQSETRYRGLFISAPVPFLDVDLSALAHLARSAEMTSVSDLDMLLDQRPDLVQDLVHLVSINDANPAAMELFGVDNRSQLLEAFAQAQRATRPNTLLKGVLSAIRLGAQSFSLESSLPMEGGGPRHLLISARPMPGNEQSMEHMLVSMLDITARKESEEKLREAHRQSQAASKAKSEFLANMSHEIRTPLSAILGLAELTQRQNDPDKTAAHLRMIAQSAQNLLAIVGDVLDLSRVEAGKLTLESIPFPPRSTLERALDPYRAGCAQKGLTLSLDLSPDLPDTLWGDPIRLGQVLGNLVGNAIKFTQNGGITVCARVQQRDESQALLLFQVADTGPGIAPEQQELIFESFPQADASFPNPYQGVGLGLAICRELRALRGGSIWVESTPGQGSTVSFTARLGLAGETARPEPPPLPRAPGETATARVLLAEDNPVNRHVFQEFLTAQGYQVFVAENGEEALDALSREAFDLVLMDVQMPVLDGLEAVRRLRAGECGTDAARLPVIALTAYAMSGDRERFLEAGMTDYLAKPVSLDALQAAVERYAPSPGSGQAPGAGMEAFLPLMDEFMAFVRERADAAAQDLEAGRLEDAARAAHDIKGASMAFGADEANRLGAQLEQALRQQDAVAARAVLDALYAVLPPSADSPNSTP